MAKPQNDFWHSQRFLYYKYREGDNSNENLAAKWGKDIYNLESNHPLIASFPNYFLPEMYDEVFSPSYITYDSHMNKIKQDFSNVRGHEFTKDEVDEINKFHPHITQCQKNVYSVFVYASMKVAGKNNWRKHFDENFAWLFDEYQGGFIWSSTKQGFSFNSKLIKPLIDSTLKSNMTKEQLMSSKFYQEVLKINDIMLLNRTASVLYFKAWDKNLPSDSYSNKQFQTVLKDIKNNVLGAMTNPDPFKGKPALKADCLNFYNNIKNNSVSKEDVLYFGGSQRSLGYTGKVSICDRISGKNPPSSGRFSNSGKEPW